MPIVSSTLPASASPACAISLSRRPPPKPASTSVANQPNAANVAICEVADHLVVIANSLGITSVARTARIAAGTDHTGSQPVGPGLGVQGRLSRDNEIARAPLATSGECIPAARAPERPACAKPMREIGLPQSSWVRAARRDTVALRMASTETADSRRARADPRSRLRAVLATGHPGRRGRRGDLALGGRAPDPVPALRIQGGPGAGVPRASRGAVDQGLAAGRGQRARVGAGRAAAGDIRRVRRVVPPAGLRGLLVHQRDARTPRPRPTGSTAPAWPTWPASGASSRAWRERPGIPDAEDFARQWHILMKGSIVAAAEGDQDAARRAKRIGAALLERR